MGTCLHREQKVASEHMSPTGHVTLTSDLSNDALASIHVDELNLLPTVFRYNATVTVVGDVERDEQFVIAMHLATCTEDNKQVCKPTVVKAQ